MKINGLQNTVVGKSLTVLDLLTINKVESPDMVAVQLNGAFVDRTAYAATAVSEGDEVDFLYFLGGGGRPGCPVAGVQREIAIKWKGIR